MKKLLSVFILMLLPMMASAYDIKIGDIYYNYINNGKELEVTYKEYLQNSYPQYDGIEISSEVTYGGKTLKVTAVGNYAFYNCSRMKSISIPNSVTIIGNNAFACSGLLSVSIPNSVTTIKRAAFCECSSLTKIIIGSGVNTIYDYAFADCPRLTDVYCYAVNVPKMLDAMYITPCTNAFKSSNIGNATLHVPAESVSAYKNKEPWNGFKSIVSISGQGGDTGGETEKGIYVKNADGVIIYYNYINNGKELEVTSMPNGKYSGVVRIPEKVTYGGNTRSVTRIGTDAFRGCTGLTSIAIPSSVTIIGTDAFTGCNSLTSVHISDLSAWCRITIKGCNPLLYAHHLYLNNQKVTELVIPNDVTILKDYAFVDCTDLTSVSISSSVTRIEESVFCGCSNLSSITIPNSVTGIWDYAFGDCSNLKDVYCHAEVVPGTNPTAFSGTPINEATLHVPQASVLSYKSKSPWNGFKEIVAIGGNNDEGGETEKGIYVKNADGVIIYYNYINNGKELEVTSMPNGKYSGVVRIPEKVTYGGNTRSVTIIGVSAFQNCSGLTSITIPNSVTSIVYSAFQNCSGLTSVTIPNSVTSIGQLAFHNCSGLTSITIPNSVTSIGFAAFSGCSGLTSVTIPNSVTSIGEVVFADCSGLTSVTIPNSVTSIGYRAFFGCSGLKDVYCHAEVVPSTDETAFSETPINQATLHVPQASVSAYKAASPWSSFKSIVAIGGNNDEGGQTATGIYVKNADGVIIYYKYINDGKDLEVTYKSLGEVSYSGVVNIPEEVTYGGKTMKVTSIGDFAFSECRGVSAVSIPNSVTNLSLYAFTGCDNLKDVTINSNSLMSKNYNGILDFPLATIFDKAERLVIGDDVKSLGKQVFFGSGYLKSVTIGSGVTSMAEDAFGDCLFITSLTINSNDIVSKNYTDNASLITVFGRDLKYLTIGEKVRSIGNYAFYDCAELLTLTLPNAIESIGDYAFYSCRSLNSLNIPNSVKSIGDYAFLGASEMKSLTLGNALERIGNDAFYASLKINELTIPEKVTDIGSRAFSGCMSLKTAIIGHSVKNIGEAAFGLCTALTTVTLGRSVENIGLGAFLTCTSLTTINSYAVDPPGCGLLCFDEVDRDHCTVYVPEGSSARYKDADEWKNFKNIKESSSLGLNQMNADEADAVGIYGMSGHRQSGLHRGINIIRMNNGKTKKVIVK